jgi:hypothetical protein
MQPWWSNGTVGQLVEPCPFHSVVTETVGACRPIMWREVMGRGLLLWLIGIPIPIILVVWLLGGLH